MEWLFNYELINSCSLLIYLSINIFIWKSSKTKDVRDFTKILVFFNIMIWVMSIFKYNNWYVYDGLKYFDYVVNASIIGNLTVIKELWDTRYFDKV